MTALLRRLVREFLVICRNDHSRMRVMGRTLSIRKSPLNETQNNRDRAGGRGAGAGGYDKITCAP